LAYFFGFLLVVFFLGGRNCFVSSTDRDFRLTLLKSCHDILFTSSPNDNQLALKSQAIFTKQAIPRRPLGIFFANQTLPFYTMGIYNTDMKKGFHGYP